jgi:hypothetical protein
MRRLPFPAAVFLTAAALTAAGCSGSPHRGADATTTATAAPAPSTATEVKRLVLTYEKPVVGAVVHAAADGLPPGRRVDLIWKTVKGGWVVEDYYHFRGKKYADEAIPLGSVAVGSDGRLDARFQIPEDFGGVHDIVARIDGRTVAQNGIEVTQSFTLTPASGPVGTPIELRVTGIGWRTMESTWVVNWDNAEVGWVSAASTKGTAVARFRAAGPAGDHAVKVYTGYQGQAYLNYEQSPVAQLPRPRFTFRVTPGRTAAAPFYVEPYPPQPVPDPEIEIDHAALALTPAQGPVLTVARLAGDGFPAGAPLTLIWETFVGSRVSGEGFAPDTRKIGRAVVGPAGRLDVPVTIPDDVGGRHGLALVDDSGKALARVFFVVETSIVGMTPASGPDGTPVSIHLKGVGWTEYDNIYVATYDNAYMGYACGFNSRGDVVVNFTAAGAPGTHVIDFYPGIYQGPSGPGDQLLYRTPQLTYARDHPGNLIPALRFAFEITPR